MEQWLGIIVLLVTCGTSLKAVTPQRPSALSQHSWTLPEGYDIPKEFVSEEKSVPGKEIISSGAHRTSNHVLSISLREAPSRGIAHHQSPLPIIRQRRQIHQQYPVHYFSTTNGFNSAIRFPFPTPTNPSVAISSQITHQRSNYPPSGDVPPNSSEAVEDSDASDTIHPYLFIGAAPPAYPQPVVGYRSGSRVYGNLRPLPPDQLLSNGRVNGFKPIANPLYYNDDPWQRGRVKNRPEFVTGDGKPTRSPQGQYDIAPPQLELLRFRTQKRPQESPRPAPKPPEIVPEDSEEDYVDYEEEELNVPKPNPFINPTFSTGTFQPANPVPERGSKSHRFRQGPSPIDAFLAQVNQAFPHHRPSSPPPSSTEDFRGLQDFRKAIGNRGRYIPGQEGIYAQHVSGERKPEQFVQKERGRIRFSNFPLEEDIIAPTDQNYDSEGEVPSSEDTSDPFENFKSEEEDVPPFKPIPSSKPPALKVETGPGDNLNEEILAPISNVTEVFNDEEESTTERYVTNEDESVDVIPTSSSSPFQTELPEEINFSTNATESETTTNDDFTTNQSDEELPTTSTMQSVNSEEETTTPETEPTPTTTETVTEPNVSDEVTEFVTTTTDNSQTFQDSTEQSAEDTSGTATEKDDVSTSPRVFHSKDQDIIELTQAPFFGDLSNPTLTSTTRNKIVPPSRPTRPQLIYTLPPIYALNPAIHSSPGTTEKIRPFSEETLSIPESDSEEDLDLKALLRQVGPVSLSELLQKHNLSLGDLLKGSGEALKALRSQTSASTPAANSPSAPTLITGLETGRNIKDVRVNDTTILPEEKNQITLAPRRQKPIANVSDASKVVKLPPINNVRPILRLPVPGLTRTNTARRPTTESVPKDLSGSDTNKNVISKEESDQLPLTILFMTSSTTQSPTTRTTTTTQRPTTTKSTTQTPTTTTVPTAKVIQVLPSTTPPSETKVSVPNPNWNLYNFNPYNQYPSADGVISSTVPPPMVMVAASLTPPPPKRESNDIEWGQDEDEAPNFPTPNIEGEGGDSAMAASAIVVSSIIGGFAIVIFLAIFVICWWRQRQRNHLRRHPVSQELQSSLIHLGLPNLPPSNKSVYGRVSQPEPSLWASLRGYN